MSVQLRRRDRPAAPGSICARLYGIEKTTSKQVECSQNVLAIYYPSGHQAHAELGHPERPERVEALRQTLQASGDWEAAQQLAPLPLSLDFLGRLHRPAYLESLQQACQRGAHLDGDTYTTTASWQLALNAAGGAAALAQAVWTGQVRRGLALTRPPGHHATAGRGMGFCLINNIAVAAGYLLQQPDGAAGPAQRLAIVDLDLHHGNGTQDIFWQSGELLFISTHQLPLYPGTGRLEETGAGPGSGCTANLPLPPYTGDQGFRAAMDEVILSLLDRFEPQMILVSFGFDTHWRDPLGQLLLSAEGYYGLLRSLAMWSEAHCAGKLALFLEGGYDLLAGQACVEAAMAALMDRPFHDPLGPAPEGESGGWQDVVRRAKQIWKL
jgi:acetoin utilization deacetylase AcuC-like enzyme